MNRLKSLREKRNKTQQDIADFLNVTQKAVSFYELGQRDIPNETLQKLADYFRVSTDYILGRDEPPKKHLPIVGGLINMLAALSPEKQEKAASYIAFLANEDKKA